MADDKKNRGKADRDRVAAEQTYEVAYFARKHRLPIGTARDLIAKVGNSREALTKAVLQMPKPTPPASPPIKPKPKPEPTKPKR